MISFKNLTLFFLGEALEKNFERRFDKLVSNNNLSPELVTAVFKSRYNLEKLESSCGDLNKLSVAGWDSYESFEGKRVLFKSLYFKFN